MALIVNEKFLPVQTVVPEISIGEIMVSADKKSTKEKTLTDAERIRRIVIPANTWETIAASINGTASQSLTDVLREAIKGIAKERLASTLEEEPLLRQVPIGDYTIAALLSWSTDTAASRGSIPFTKDQLTAWWTVSATKASLTAKWTAGGDDAAKIKVKEGFASKRFYALAAKNHGLKDADDARKLLALMDEKDLTNGIGCDIANRISSIIKAKEEEKKEENMSMDDL